MNALFAMLSAKLNVLTSSKDRGATAVEYGLLVGLIAVVIIVAVTTLGTQLDGLFDSVTDELPAVAPAT